ncbi:MAG: RNA polymerase sigma factor [Pseudomonadota bacterium]
MQIFANHHVLSPQSGVIEATIAFVERWLLCLDQDAKRVAMHEEAESNLIAAARNGDEDASRQIIERFQPMLSTQMSRFSRDRNVVEDLVHDVFVEALLSLASFKGKSPFEHWLRKIAVRVGYRHWKRLSREKERLEIIRTEAACTTSEPEQQSAAVEARDQLDVMLAKLSPRDRLVLTLLYWDGCSVAETAKRIGWTQSLVKVQAHRARKRLKKLLEVANEE